MSIYNGRSYKCDYETAIQTTVNVIQYAAMCK